MTGEMHTVGTGLIDTNILVYFLDVTEIEKHERAKKFLDKVIENPKKFFLAFQNLREFCSVVTSKKLATKEEIKEYLSIFKDALVVLYDEIQDLEEASLNVLDKNTWFWDSMLAATMQRNGVNIIYTENVKDFSKFPGLKAINPLS